MGGAGTPQGGDSGSGSSTTNSHRYSRGVLFNIIFRSGISGLILPDIIIVIIGGVILGDEYSSQLSMIGLG